MTPGKPLCRMAGSIVWLFLAAAGRGDGHGSEEADPKAAMAHVWVPTATQEGRWMQRDLFYSEILGENRRGHASRIWHVGAGRLFMLESTGE